MVKYETTCTVIHHEVEVPVILRYNSADPAAVEFSFYNAGDDEPMVWTFGRDLVKNVLENGKSGEGDVVFRAYGSVVQMQLISDDSQSAVKFHREVFQEFCDMVYDEIPEGKDEYQFEDEVYTRWLEAWSE